MKKIMMLVALCAFSCVSHAATNDSDTHEQIRRITAEIRLAVEQSGVPAEEVAAVVAHALQGTLRRSGVSFITPEEREAYINYFVIALTGFVIGVGLTYVPTVWNHFFSAKEVLVQPVSVEAPVQISVAPAVVVEPVVNQAVAVQQAEPVALDQDLAVPQAEPEALSVQFPSTVRTVAFNIPEPECGKQVTPDPDRSPMRETIMHRVKKGNRVSIRDGVNLRNHGDDDALRRAGFDVAAVHRERERRKNNY